MHTNPRHREEEPQSNNSRKAKGRHCKAPVPSLSIKMNDTKNRASQNGSSNKQRINIDRTHNICFN